MPPSSQEGRQVRKAAGPPTTWLSWNEIKDHVLFIQSGLALAVLLPLTKAQARTGQGWS